jgi:hypothetical protein
MKPSDTHLTKKADIATALAQGAAVFADCMNLPERLPVKDVKTSEGILRVRVLEGWRVPFAVYISSPLPVSKFQTKPGVIRLFRLGDFLEAFDEDAETVGRELVLTVTSTRGDNPRRMAGVPEYARDRYIGELRAKGYKVEVVE